MPRPTFADPKTDFAFKRIFGSEDHKDVLVAFLNNMLDLDEPHRIVRVELLPPEQRPPVPELKLSIVDVKCTDAHGVTYVVEMQVLQVEGFEKRVVYNVAKAYVNQVSRDLDDDGLPEVIFWSNRFIPRGPGGNSKRGWRPEPLRSGHPRSQASGER